LRARRTREAFESAQKFLVAGRPRLAVEKLETLVRTHPDDPRFLHAWTTALWLSGQHEQAVRAVRGACARFPYDQALRLNLAMCLSQLGKTKKALSALTWAVLLGYDDFDTLATSPAFRPLSREPAMRRLLRERVPDPKWLRAD